jgi:hypothetical protein
MVLEKSEILKNFKGEQAVNIIMKHATAYGLKTEIIKELGATEIWVKDESMDTTECYYVTPQFTSLKVYKGV